MGKKVVHSETKQVVPEPFNSILPGPKYKTENTHEDGTKVTGYGDSKTESKNDANDKSSSSGGCFLTTACVSYYGLSDNCNELMTLRHFRDTYVSHLPDGEKTIEEYYTVSPEIIKKIEMLNHSDKNTAYAEIFKMVCGSVSLIRDGEFQKAFECYSALFIRLKQAYCL